MVDTNNRLEPAPAASKVAIGPCGASKARDQPPGSAGPTTTWLARALTEPPASGRTPDPEDGRSVGTAPLEAAPLWTEQRHVCLLRWDWPTRSRVGIP